MKLKHIAPLLTLLAASATCIAMHAQKSSDSALQRNVRTVQSILERLQSMYVDSVDMDKHLKTGIYAMLQSLDPYTEYYTQEEADQFRSNSAGEFGGIGIRIATYDGQAYLTDPMPGYPAFKAGLRSGDKVVKVDTTITRGRDANFVTKLIKGQPGTPVVITIVRPNTTDSLLSFTMERAKVAIPAVTYSTILPSGIGYLQLSTFSPDNTADQVREVLQDFKKDRALKGIILDLGDNGGGLLSQAIEIASMFLPRGTKILETKGRHGGESVVYKTKKDPIFPDIPLAVIIDRGSASASEVLAGALQDYDRAVLIGERSFGKGLVQSTLPMPYDGMLKVTTAKYYIPSGRLIQALDYSHRDANGHPGYTPDSLANTFYTAAGRPVKDGGGLQPEVAVKDSIENYYMVYNLANKPYMFNFANNWFASHPSSADSQFVMTDEVWDAFAASLPDKAFDYDTNTSKALERLHKLASDDIEITPDIEAQFTLLGKMLRPDHKAELAKSRREVERLLVPMLAERYGFQNAAYRATLDYEPAVIEAEKILLDKSRYNKLLNHKK